MADSSNSGSESRVTEVSESEECEPHLSFKSSEFDVDRLEMDGASNHISLNPRRVRTAVLLRATQSRSKPMKNIIWWIVCIR